VKQLTDEKFKLENQIRIGSANVTNAELKAQENLVTGKQIQDQKFQLERQLENLKEEKVQFNKEQELVKAKLEEDSKQNEENRKLWYQNAQKKLDAESKALFSKNMLNMSQ